MTISTPVSQGRIGEVVPYFLRLGLLGFGGPIALVGQMERELVGERKWLTKEQMREAIAVCQSLPGPLAIQVGIYISYLRTGFWGASPSGSDNSSGPLHRRSQSRRRSTTVFLMFWQSSQCLFPSWHTQPALPRGDCRRSPIFWSGWRC